MSNLPYAIWLIESRLFEPIALADISAQLHLSPSHASRMFSAISGQSLTAYIRGRRLSEAAKILARGAPDILAVALDAGYGSHEAFTRAFRDQFGVTPEEVRRRRSTETLTLLEPLPMTTTTTTNLAPPRIEREGPIRIAGLVERQSMSDGAGISGQWLRFARWIGNINGQVGMAAYGFAGEMYADCDDFDYVAGVEVTSSANLPPELKSFEVRPQRWAKFTHQGHISGIRNTIAAIYNDWLPRSGETPGGAGSFLEYYGPDFDGRTGTGTVEIWIGLAEPSY